ncbi:MAG: 60S ribosomal protein L28 [Candidatus Hodarchaeota archaeon]
MVSSEIITAWRYLDRGHCAFKSAATSPTKMRCNHLFTVTGTHQFTDCPLIQPKYFAFQQQERLVYLIEKNPEAAPAAMWGFTELPDDREKARKVVERKIKDLNDSLKVAIRHKFEQQFDLADVIKTSEELADEVDEEEEI